MTTPQTEIPMDEQVAQAARELRDYNSQDLRNLPSTYEDLGTVGDNGEFQLSSNTPDTPVVILYRTDNGDPVPIHRYLLGDTLALVDPVTRLPRFSQEPVLLPERQTMVCLLHPDHPQRGRWDSMGLPVCLKTGFLSEYEVRIHMEKKHKAANAIINSYIQEERQKFYEEQERERHAATIALQNRLADAALGVPAVEGHVCDFKAYGYPTPPGARCGFVDPRTGIRCPVVKELEPPDDDSGE